MPSEAPSRAMRTLRVPEEIARGLEKRMAGSSFESVDAFVSFVLARLLEENRSTVFSEEDERNLKERLRSLGYID